MENPPHELFLGCETSEDRAARFGRWLILQEMGFFGEKSNLPLARGDYKGTFIAAVRKKFSNLYGDIGGCHPGDIENAAVYLDVFDDVFDVEASNNTKHLQDRHGKAA